MDGVGSDGTGFERAGELFEKLRRRVIPDDDDDRGRFFLGRCFRFRLFLGGDPASRRLDAAKEIDFIVGELFPILDGETEETVFPRDFH